MEHTPTKNDSKPSVGIALATFNDSEHVSEALNSLINQSYTNITIFISDDCSTDQTENICESYASKYKNIVFTKNIKNIGSALNHKKLLSMVNTDYFMFARANELMSENLVENCVNILKEDANVVNAFATTKWMDKDGNEIPKKHISHFDTRGCEVVARCALVIWGNCNYFYGMTRTEIVKKIRIFEESMGADHIMLFEMALLGTFAHAPESVRYRRYTNTDDTYSKRIVRYKTIYTEMNFLDKIFPYLALPFYFFQSLFKSKVSLSEKLLITFVILTNSPIRYIISRGKTH